MLTVSGYEQPSYVESRSVPMREQYPDTSISLGQDSAGGSVISISTA
jgi:hypothetical protein